MAEASDAAFAVATDLAAELVQKFPLPESEEGDDRLRSDVLRAIPQAPELPNVMKRPVEGAEGPSGEEAVAAQDEHEATLEIPNYEIEVPDDLLSELDEPDFDALAEAELATDQDEEILYDEQDTEERKRRIAAEKKAAWLEGRLAETNRSKWETEAKKYFPLSEHSLANIKSDSRRGFLREARKAHEAVLPYVKPLVDQLRSAGATAEQEGLDEGREKAKAAWGTPTTGPGTVPVAASANSAELEEARRSGSLARVIGVMRKQAAGR